MIRWFSLSRTAESGNTPYNSIIGGKAEIATLGNAPHLKGSNFGFSLGIWNILGTSLLNPRSHTGVVLSGHLRVLVGRHAKPSPLHYRTHIYLGTTDAILKLNGYEVIGRSDRTDTQKGRGGGILIFSRLPHVFENVKSRTEQVVHATT